jgi:hypothetical protein
MAFCGSSTEMAFPTIEKLQIPLRSTLDGQIVTTGSLSRLALDNMLLKAPDWYGTVKTSLHLLSNQKIVGFVGFGNYIPASLLQIPDLHVLSLGHEASESRRNISVPYINGNTTGTTADGLHASTNGALPKLQPKVSEYPPHSIAITGMACRFPEADSVDEFWELLLSLSLPLRDSSCLKQLMAQVPSGGEASYAILRLSITGFLKSRLEKLLHGTHRLEF